MATSPAMEEAFKTWRDAQAALDYVEWDRSFPEDAKPALYDAAGRAMRALARTPAETADDVVLKLCGLAHCECNPPLGAGPFEFHRESARPERPYEEDDLWEGLLVDLPRVSPLAKELIAMPARQEGGQE